MSRFPSRFPARRSWLGRRVERSTAPPFNAYKVLRGLSPALVIDLARLAGATLDDLEVTFQLMPWGDRATLAAYRVVTLDDVSDTPGRGLRVHPVALDLVSAAAEVAAAAAEPRAVAHLLMQRERDLEEAEGEPVPVAVATLSEQKRSGAKLVEGVVHAVDVKDGAQLVAVEVRATEADDGTSASSRASQFIVVSPTTAFVVRRTSPVVLSYENASTGARPMAISKAARTKR
jgi:hypothetical protein